MVLENPGTVEWVRCYKRLFPTELNDVFARCSCGKFTRTMWSTLNAFGLRRLRLEGAFSEARPGYGSRRSWCLLHNDTHTHTTVWPMGLSIVGAAMQVRRGCANAGVQPPKKNAFGTHESGSLGIDPLKPGGDRRSGSRRVETYALRWPRMRPGRERAMRHAAVLWLRRHWHAETS